MEDSCMQTNVMPQSGGFTVVLIIERCYKTEGERDGASKSEKSYKRNSKGEQKSMLKRR